MLVPPELPPLLATMFDLKPIAGVPSIEEVKLVHAVMRTINSLLHTPDLRDSDLPMELSQYLFDIQMTRHREKYPVGIFPNEIVYTPPTIPAHIPVRLEPVVGPPSDDELRSAHGALRVSESFSSTITSLFDVDLCMELSQHVFDLQLARHVQRSTQTLNRGPARVAPDPNTGDGPNERVRDTDAHLAATPTEEERNGLQETNRLLAEVGETLKNVNRVLIGTQNSLARGFNSSHSGIEGRSISVHGLINNRGETPEAYGLPILKDYYGKFYREWPGNLSMNVLARYLQFYDIGSEMLEEGGELTIKAGMEKDAKTMLMRHLYSPPI